MIGRIKGVLIEKLAPLIMVDVNGVAYELQVPMTTYCQLGDLESEVTLYTHFSVSENSQQLFGFAKKGDRELFRLLIKVSGVGPKMANGIMSIESYDLARCILDDNVSALVKVPGVGKKTAERLIIEMRDKLSAWQRESSGTRALPSTLDLESVVTDFNAEAESALIALGYKPAEASKAVSRASSNGCDSAEELIRAALKSMLPAQ